MDRHAIELRNLPSPQDPTLQLEGVIWRPEHSGANEDRLRDALVYATRLHGDQTRKDEEDTPYIAHLLGVCSLVLEAGGDEEQAIAALLHDAVEDQGGRERLREVRNRFGDRVADIVEVCTDAYERPKRPWGDRKKEFLAGLSEEEPEALLVVCADKLYNARAILRDYRIHGETIFDRFTGKRDGTLWYYRSLAERLEASDLDSWLVDELGNVVNSLVKAAG